jgi:hypothetical protein
VVAAGIAVEKLAITVEQNPFDLSEAGPKEGPVKFKDIQLTKLPVIEESMANSIQREVAFGKVKLNNRQGGDISGGIFQQGPIVVASSICGWSA